VKFLFMEQLNLILIIVGLVILALIVFLEFNRRKAQKEERSWMDIKNVDAKDPLETAADDDYAYEQQPQELYIEEPEFEEEESTSYADEAQPDIEPVAGQQELFEAYAADEDLPEEETNHQPPQAIQIDESVRSEYGEVFVLTVMAKEDDMFEGADLLREFTALNLQHAEDRLYHRPMPGRRDISLFSIANVMRPGEFEPKKMLDLKTKGLLLFMRLPGKLEPVQAFDQFYDAADSLALALGGQICDEHRNVLGSHRLEQLRDKIRHLELKLELERRKADK